MINHHHTAQLLDQAYRAVAALARAIPAPGAGVGTVGGAFSQVNAGLWDLRRLLDAEAVAAGLASPYVHRYAKAGPALAAAARAAALAALEEEERQLEARRARTWRGTPSPRVTGPSGADSSMGDGDGLGSVLSDRA